MTRRLVRWTDLVGAFGLVALLVWAPMYIADGHADDVATDRVVLPPPRDGMRLETVVVVELANGDRFEVGPWVDVAFDAVGTDGRNWTATITRHPAALQVGDLAFEQAAAVHAIHFVDGRPQDAWREGDKERAADGGGPGFVHVSGPGSAEVHELASTRFTELTIARDVAEAVVEVVTRVPNLDPGDGKAQKAASSVSGRTVRFGDEVVYAANGGDLRRIATDVGGFFGEGAKDGTFCDMPLREPWTVLHEQGSIRWDGLTAIQGCQQYQWDWYSAAWPAPVGFHREVRDGDGRLVFQLDVVPRLVTPGDGPVLAVAAPEERPGRLTASSERVPLSASLEAPVRWAGLWTGPGLIAALRDEGSMGGADLDGVVALGGIAWLDRSVASERFEAPAACTWSAERPFMFWVDLVHDNGSVLQTVFAAAPEGGAVGNVSWRWAEAAYPAPAGAYEVFDWWSRADVARAEADRQGASTWLGAFGASLPARGLEWRDDDACLDLAYGALDALLPRDGTPRLHFAALVDDDEGGTLHLVGQGGNAWAEAAVLETVYVPPAAARAADAPAGPYASGSGISPSEVGPARAVDVIDHVGASFGVAGAAALGLALGARLFAALRGGGWVTFGALFVRGADLSRREAIAAFVARHPGVTLSELAAGLELGWGAMLHHVEALRKTGRLVRVADGARVHLFAVDDAAAPRSEAERWRHIVNRRARYADVWNALDVHAGATATDLAKTVGRHRTSVARTLDRLREVGLVESERDGRRVRFQRVV